MDTKVYHRICESCGKAFCSTSKDDKVCAICQKKTGFKKADKGKLEWHLLPFDEVKQVVEILQFGKEKYGENNWQKCEDTKRYEDALMRHVVAYMSGNKKDDESGKSHLAHAICNCLFLMHFDDNEDGNNEQ